MPQKYASTGSFYLLDSIEKHSNNDEHCGLVAE